MLFTQGLMHLRARASYRTHTRRIRETGKQNCYESWTPGTPQRPVPWFSFAPTPWTGCWRNCPPEAPRGQTRPPGKPLSSQRYRKGEALQDRKRLDNKHSAPTKHQRTKPWAPYGLLPTRAERGAQRSTPWAGPRTPAGVTSAQQGAGPLTSQASTGLCPWVSGECWAVPWGAWTCSPGGSGRLSSSPQGCQGRPVTVRICTALSGEVAPCPRCQGAPSPTKQ